MSQRIRICGGIIPLLLLLYLGRYLRLLLLWQIVIGSGRIIRRGHIRGRIGLRSDSPRRRWWWQSPCFPQIGAGNKCIICK
jgi:hypothetical protein